MLPKNQQPQWSSDYGEERAMPEDPFFTTWHSLERQ